MYFYFFFNDTATTEIYTLSLHDALPISQNLDSIFTLDKKRKEGQQFIVEADELVPDIHATAQCILVRFECLFANVTRFQRSLDLLRTKTGTVHGDADSRRKDRIDKTSCITDHQEAIPTEFVKDVAIIAFRLEIVDALRIRHRPRQSLVGFNVGVEIALRL